MTFSTISLYEKETKLVFKRDDTGKINFAVVDLRAISPVAVSDAVFLSTFFRKEILKNEQFNLLDRNNMDRILAEQGFQQTGCTTSECIVQIGKLLNVNYILTGNFGKLGDKYLITVQITDIESGKIVYTDRETLAVLAPEPAEYCVKALLTRLFIKTE
ncbi:MAG: CsgG/HfaB family protein [Elusimicrobiota bacterium]